MTATFVARKVVGSLATLVFVLTFNFFLFRVVDSDPVGTLFRGRNISQVQRERLAHDFGIDKPLPDQFVRYLDQTAHFNFGFSFETRQPVTSEIYQNVWATVWLVGLSTLLSTVIGIAIGIQAAWKHGSAFDRIATSITMIFYAMPDFWLGLLLLAAFAAALGWFPTGGIINAASGATGFAHIVDEAKHIFLPCLTLTLAYLGEYTLIMRSSLLDTMGEDYLVLAPRRGCATHWCGGATPSSTRCCRSSPCRRSTSASSSPAQSRSSTCTRGRDWGSRRSTRHAHPTSRCCKACSSCSARQ